MGSAGFQPAVPGILPGTLVCEPSEIEIPAPRRAPGAPGRDAGRGTLEACAPLCRRSSVHLASPGTKIGGAGGARYVTHPRG